MKGFWNSLTFPGALKYRLCMLLPAAVLAGLDQWFKYLAVALLKDNPATVLIEGVLELLYVENTGAAFSMLADQRWFFIVVTTVVLLFLLGLIFSGRYRSHALLNVSFCLVLAGGVGNLIDRIAHGYVVDYIYFKWIDFPVFNFADCCLVIGAIVMLIFFFFVYEDTKPQKGNANDDKDTSDN